MTVNFLLFFILALTVPYQTTAQENSVGIFLTQKLTKNCQNILFTRNKKIKVCTPEKPIIWSEEFAYITEIRIDEAQKLGYFNLFLSQKGYDKIKSVIEQLAGTELVLVVDNTVVGFIKNKDQIVNKSILIDGPAHSEELEWVFASLQKTIRPKK